VSRVAVAVAAVGLVAVGCSTASTIDEYAASASSAADAYVTESQNLSYDYQSAVEDGVRAIADEEGEGGAERVVELVSNQTVAYLATLTDTMGRYLDALDELSPPSAVRERHEAYLDAIRFVLAAIPDARSAVEVAPDIEGIQLALSGSSFADGQVRWTGACTALEQAIRDEGGDVNLRCVRSEPTG
jgi:hypothetical protein